jgi:hypothetical protein
VCVEHIERWGNPNNKKGKYITTTTTTSSYSNQTNERKKKKPLMSVPEACDSDENPL